MIRREFITLVGAAAAWPFAASAQQGERVRRIGVLLPATADSPGFQARVGAFLQGLQQLGWRIGQNVQVDIRWATPDAEVVRKRYGIGRPGAARHGPMLQATRTVPIVFPVAADPVGAGFVRSLARPGGNATGFMSFEYGIGGKWLELLKEIAPKVTRVAVLRDPAIASGIGIFGVMQAMAASLRMEVAQVNLRDPGEVERAVLEFAPAPTGGLILTASPLADSNRVMFATLAAQHKLPAVYYERVFATTGGLVSYGPDFVDQFRRSAEYVDRILRGEKPADLPVQAPTKYELVINLKTAKALGLEIPSTLLARADEVIE